MLYPAGLQGHNNYLYSILLHLTRTLSFAMLFLEEKMQIHATDIEWQKKGILFIGKSGYGKSTAALLLMEKGAKLIADDQVILTLNKKRCIATCADTIKNKMEVRGIGVVDVEAKRKTSVDLVVFLTKKAEDVPRMPEAQYWNFVDVRIPAITLCAFENAFCQRLNIAIKTLLSFCLPKQYKCARTKNNKRGKK